MRDQDIEAPVIEDWEMGYGFAMSWAPTDLTFELKPSVLSTIPVPREKSREQPRRREPAVILDRTRKIDLDLE